jgi:hypothetical protein
MKKIFFALVCLFMAVNLMAQQPIQNRMKERVEAQRIGFITQRVNLTPEESQQFWPIYNQYTDKMQQIRSSSKIEKPSDEMSDADIEKMIMTQMDKESRILDLRKEYYQKLKKVISVKKIAKLYKAEQDFKGEMLKQLQEMRQMKKNMREEKN